VHVDSVRQPDQLHGQIHRGGHAGEDQNRQGLQHPERLIYLYIAALVRIYMGLDL
jgi:hypothetical protein